jgi:hypothetical protein
VKGANLFKEQLMAAESRSSKRSSRRGSVTAGVVAESATRWNSRVESILVCTGVYNPENDLLVYLRSLFNATSLADSNSNSEESEPELIDANNNAASAVNSNRRHGSSVSLKKDDLHELKSAMSRKNSFISYFDDKMNVPDVTVNTLKDAVDYIIKSIREN